MSRPRREWWSFLLVRRCSVRWLIRSVSRATWTRVLPVSLSLAPNCVTISRVRSGVRVLMRRERIQTPCLLYVGCHLLQQRVDRREAALAPQALEELDPQLLAVEI